MITRINKGAKPDSALSIWTVYKLFQGGATRYIARHYAVDPQGQSFIVDHLRSDQLGEVRTELARRGLSCLARQANDEPAIVEVWL